MRILKWIAIVIVVIIGIGAVGFQIMKSNTKKHSPEATVHYTENGLDIEIVYSRPFKKDREIFGGLVPYGKVWRTGANEATTFNTETDLIINNEATLPKGEYTIWTIPNGSKWEVIFNDGDYGWGVNLNAEAARDQKYDVVNVTVPVQRNFKVLEQFTIEIEGTPPALLFSWDVTRVDVPIAKAE